MGVVRNNSSSTFFFVFVCRINSFGSPQTFNNHWKLLGIETYEVLTDNINYIGVCLRHFKMGKKSFFFQFTDVYRYELHSFIAYFNDLSYHILSRYAFSYNISCTSCLQKETLLHFCWQKNNHYSLVEKWLHSQF